MRFPYVVKKERLLIYGKVIRLKQVDHVNQEREALADVAGHPFIVTLITTFADYDSLYMLVSYSLILFSYPTSRLLSANSSKLTMFSYPDIA